MTQAQKEKDPTESGSVVIQSPGLGESAVWILFSLLQRGCFVLNESGLLAGSQTIPLVILSKLSASFWVLLGTW